MDYLRQAPLDRLALPAQAREELGGAGLGLGELRFLGTVNLRVRRDDPIGRAALESALGAPLPKVGKSVAAGAATLLALGPDEWLAVGDDGPALARRLAEATPGQFLGITDVSENYTTLVLRGPAARQVLAKGCPLDLDASIFKPGDAASSLVAKATVVLRLLADEAAGAVFHLLVRRSFAEYLYRWLEDAGREYGVVVVQG